MNDFLSPQQINSALREQRSSIRIDLDVFARIAKLSPKQYELYHGAFDELRRKFSLSMLYMQEMRHTQALIRKLKVRNPDVAQLAQSLDKRLTLMNELSDSQMQFMGERFLQRVNISVDGARVQSTEQLAPGDKVCFRMMHSDSSTFFIALAEVVYTVASSEVAAGFNSAGALKFTRSNSMDRETLGELIVNLDNEQGQGR